MTPRILDRAEWATKLAGTELEATLPYLPPNAYVLVIEDEADRVVGCWSALQYWHVEGLFIAPAHRKHGVVARRLLIAMGHLLQRLGIGSVVTTALTDDVKDLIVKFGGTQLPGEHYVLPVGGTH